MSEQPQVDYVAVDLQSGLYLTEFGQSDNLNEATHYTLNTARRLSKENGAQVYYLPFAGHLTDFARKERQKLKADLTKHFHLDKDN